MSDFDAFVNSLIDEPIVRTGATEQRFSCGQCGGTGKWSGGTNRHGNSNCLACKGKGYFTTSPKVRNDARVAREAKMDEKADQLRRAVKEFSEEHPDMWKDLVASRTEFTASLYGQLMSKGFLSERQIAAWNTGWAKLQAARAARNVEATAKSGTADLDAIRTMFDAAVASGYKKPTYRAEGLKISLASLTGRNAGCLYVVEINDDAYQGKIEGVTFKAVREAKADTLARLQIIAADPAAAAVAYGRRTGTCACCGRELTDPVSIEAGIGPICASKWGF
ncbi:MAG: Ralstonia phage [Pseudomonadota bacterium]